MELVQECEMFESLQLCGEVLGDNMTTDDVCCAYRWAIHFENHGWYKAGFWDFRFLGVWSKNIESYFGPWTVIVQWKNCVIGNLEMGKWSLWTNWVLCEWYCWFKVLVERFPVQSSLGVHDTGRISLSIRFKRWYFLWCQGVRRYYTNDNWFFWFKNWTLQSKTEVKASILGPEMT